MSDVDAAVTARLESWTADARRRAAVGEGRLAVGGVRQAGRGGGRLARLARPAGRHVGARRRARAPRPRRPRGRLSARRRARHGRLEPGAGALQPRLRLGGGRRQRLGPPMDSSCASSTRPTPTSVRGFRSWAGAERTIFCVSSKSGSTTEPNAFQAAMGEVAPALDFIAITDPGSSLGELARAQEFRAIVEAPPDVGGRYSALTVFGLVPAALHGVDLAGCSSARPAWRTRATPATRRRTPGCALGALIGEAALAGRDKLTILTSPIAWPPSATGPSSSSPRARARRARESCRSSASRPPIRPSLRRRSLLRLTSR